MTPEQTQELIQLLRKAQELGLTFDIGAAYISRAYITQQDELNFKIDKLLKNPV